jgi:hypothetical protein
MIEPAGRCPGGAVMSNDGLPPEPTDVTSFPGTRSARPGTDAWPALPIAKHPLRYSPFLLVSPDSSQMACAQEYGNQPA